VYGGPRTLLRLPQVARLVLAKCDRIGSHLRAAPCYICLRRLHTRLHAKKYVRLLCLFSCLYLDLLRVDCLHAIACALKSSHKNYTYLPQRLCKNLPAFSFLHILKPGAHHRHYATSRKFAGFILDEVCGFSNLPNPSSRTMALELT
jgi:hypothetical protein